MILRLAGGVALVVAGFLSGMVFHEFRIQRWIERSLDLRDRTMYSLRGLR